MTVTTQDRPIEAVREEVIDQLTMNYGHGTINLEAFERRLDQAMECNDSEVLVTLTADLTLVVDDAFMAQKEKELKQTQRITGDSKSHESIVNIFSSSKRTGQWEVAKKTKIFCLFSSSDIDLSNAIFTHDEIHIEIFSLFSSSTIYTPEDIKIASRAVCIFASVDNQATSVVHNNSVTLFFEGVALFSSIEIKIKQTLKEKFLQFADGFKKLFS
jgi:cell wall-active antibiotic response 4TMS protein YvqF/uncharacterized protein DUF1707